MKTSAPLGAYATRKLFRCFAYAAGFYAVAFPGIGTVAEFVEKLKTADHKAKIHVIINYELQPPRL